MNVVPLPQVEQALDSWESFWLLYPRRVAKKDARRAWAKIPDSQHVPILIAIAAWRNVWRDKDPEYLPHPATWLNGERWEDELPAGYKYTPSASTTPVARTSDIVCERAPIPGYITALIAKLRVKP